MLKKIGMLFIVCSLSACSMPTFFDANTEDKVTENKATEIDQKSYDYAYTVTLQGKQGMITENFYVDEFNKGVEDWNKNRILLPISEIQAQLYKNGSGHDSKNYAYFNGVIFAYELKEKLKLFSQNCYQSIDNPSLTLGIQDAIIDLKNKEEKDFSDATGVFLESCSK